MFCPILKPSQIRNIAGQTFGKLTAIEPVGTKAKKVHWRCRCECGSISIHSCDGLVSGGTKSCGCLKPELARSLHTKHGGSRVGAVLPEYRIWRAMRERCNNPSQKHFASYGGRGIHVCPEWNAPSGFPAFLADMGRRPTPAHSIDRIDNDMGYSPENCRWTTKVRQSNNRRSNTFVDVFGEKMTLADAARKYGKASYQVVWHRIYKQNMQIEDALVLPPRTASECAKMANASA